MHSITVDNLIVGAGPAGCAAGYQLVTHKAETLILERESLATKDKLCGGAMQKGLIFFLMKIYHTFFLPQCIYLERTLSVKNDGEPCEKKGFVLTCRKELDEWFIVQYQNAGGKIWENFHTVSVDAKNRQLSGFDLHTKEEMVINYQKLLVADGASSHLRKLVTGRAPRSTMALEIAYSKEESYPDTVFFTYDDLHGYAWNFTHKTGSYLGVCSYRTIPLAVLRDKLRALTTKLNLPYREPRGALIPYGDDILTEQDGTLFLGDAAGFIDPITGGGIHLAVFSGVMAARSILHNKSYTDLMEGWSKMQRQSCEKRDGIEIEK